MSEIEEEPSGDQNNPDPESSSSSVPPDHPPNDEDMQRFTQEVNDLKRSTREIRERVHNLHNLNNNSEETTGALARTVTQNRVVLEIADFCVNTAALKKRLENLDRSNAANRAIMNCGAGSRTDRNRMSATSDLKRELRETADDIQALITAAEMEERLEAVNDVINLLKKLRTLFQEMGIEPPEPAGESQRDVLDEIEVELQDLVDKVSTKKNPLQGARTLGHRIKAMVRGCWGRTSTS